MKACTAALWLCLVLCACGGGEPALTAEDYRRRGDAAFTAADAMMTQVEAGELSRVGQGSETLHAEAVRAYTDAANDLVRSFRMEDPLPARRGQRAMLAFRIGRALSNAARQGVTLRRRGHLAQRAVFWFGEALALEPALHPAEFERAVLYESEIGSVRDVVRAHEAYGAFLQATAGFAGDEAHATARLRKRAAKRRAALAALPEVPAGG